MIAKTEPAATWKALQDAKKIEQNSRIPEAWKLKENPPEDIRDVRSVAETCGILTERELKITGDNYDATSLAGAIGAGTLTSVEVVRAFCKRAAIGHQTCNMLTEIMFEQALQQAERLDEVLRSTGKVVGPLHGVPMTFKECFHFEGYDSSNGYLSRVFQPVDKTSPLAELLQNAGAIIIAKTNVPQTMLVAESDNNVFGRTKNPCVSHLTCGGSSGGEGASQAFRCSALGVGTDVGGSIRIPAAANGVYGYKPSFGIIPMIGYSYSGWVGSNTGIPAVAGPMGHSMRDLSLFARVIRDTKPWLLDPAVIPNVMEMSFEPARKPPVVGVIYQSGLTPHPPVRRAIREAVQKLSATGFEVREFNPPDFLEIRKVTEQLFTLDGLSYPKQELEKVGEPVVSSVKKIGFWDLPRKSQEEAWHWNAKKGKIQKEMLDEWKRVGCDVILTPAGPHTAVLPGNWLSDIYTVAWNCVDYPAVILPFTQADKEKDPVDTAFRPLDDADLHNQAMYDPELMHGAPVAVQIVGFRLEDKHLLRHAELIDSVLNGQ
ncbi:putative general amidase protein [Phaeoacremonium minimum UCRPA7]|uniref:Putative general amidase protein n=1 Tax=Phaeoacremonium minimum (strain UCR-PA7) TaxID=1286976 RepID=R8BVK7_PHAM7|nr:putative general amidase protein [Phaeoacremonium minimum UCRPA7]EOO03393.1 putative general amidase protein [Phaeoacremonium minimum UCRPA7]